MRNIRSISAALMLVLSLAACSSGGGGGGNNAGGGCGGFGALCNDKNNVAPAGGKARFTQDELMSDAKGVDQLEANLQTVGLKFANNQQGDLIWDQQFFQIVLQQNPGLQKSQLIQPLQAFVNGARAFEKKYQGQFTIHKSDGTDAAGSLPDALVKLLDAKIKLANDAIARAQQSPNLL